MALAKMVDVFYVRTRQPDGRTFDVAKFFRVLDCDTFLATQAQDVRERSSIHKVSEPADAQHPAHAALFQ